LINDIAKLNAQLKTCKDECDKIKFARDGYTIGRHPFIKELPKGAKDKKSHEASDFIKEKGEAPMATSVHSRKNHVFIYAKNVHHAHHDACVNYVVPARLLCIIVTPQIH
jgi:hypothetical protein